MIYNSIIKNLTSLQEGVKYKEIETNESIFIVIYEDDIILNLVNIVKTQNKTREDLIEQGSKYFLNNLLKGALYWSRSNVKRCPSLHGKLSELENKLLTLKVKI